MRKFVGAFEKLNDLPSVGFHLETTKYIVPRTEENLIFGKQGKMGVFAFRSKMGKEDVTKTVK